MHDILKVKNIFQSLKYARLSFSGTRTYSYLVWKFLFLQDSGVRRGPADSVFLYIEFRGGGGCVSGIFSLGKFLKTRCKILHFEDLPFASKNF